MREEIVEAGLAQFHERGFNAAAVKDITDRAGVPKGSFYNHFESKEALAIEALERYGVSMRLGDLADKSVEPLARIRAHFEYLRHEVLGYGNLRGCMLGNFTTEVADHNDSIQQLLKQGLGLWAERLGGALAEAQEAGSIPAGLDTAMIGRNLVSAWEGTLIRVRAERSPEPFDDFFTVTFDVLLA